MGSAAELATFSADGSALAEDEEDEEAIDFRRGKRPSRSGSARGGRWGEGGERERGVVRFFWRLT